MRDTKEEEEEGNIKIKSYLRQKQHAKNMSTIPGHQNNTKPWHSDRRKNTIHIKTG